MQTHSKASLNGWPLTHRRSLGRPCGTHPATGRPVSQGLAGLIPFGYYRSSWPDRAPGTSGPGWPREYRPA